MMGEHFRHTCQQQESQAISSFEEVLAEHHAPSSFRLFFQYGEYLMLRKKFINLGKLYQTGVQLFGPVNLGSALPYTM
jgi:hypothetical protein